MVDGKNDMSVINVQSRSRNIFGSDFSIFRTIRITEAAVTIYQMIWFYDNEDIRKLQIQHPRYHRTAYVLLRFLRQVECRDG